MSAYVNYNRFPGPGDLPGGSNDPRDPSYDSSFDERVEELLAEFCKDPKKIVEADEWVAGGQSGDHYSDVERALADLHGVEPSDLSESDLLTRLYGLAKVHGEAREKKLREMAEQQACDEFDSDEQARAEAAMDRRDAA